MTRFIRILIILIFCRQISIAQNSLVKLWDYRYGGTGNDKLEVFQQTTDGGYLLGGISSSEATGDKTEPSWNNSADYWIVKIDASGIYQWDKGFGGTRTETLKSILQTRDKGYVLGGYSNSGIGGDKTQDNWDPAISSAANPTNDYWIVKTDSLGNKQWDKRFGGIHDDKFSCLLQTDDGGFLLGGFSASGIGGDKTQASRGSTDYWIVKLDASGNKQWDRRFGGTNNEQLYSISLSHDGGYLLGGYSWSGVSGDKSQANWGASNYCDFWIVKIDASGNKQWDKRLGGSYNDQLCYSLSTNDGGFVLGGFSWSGISGDKTQANVGPSHTADFWIVKIDSIGNIQWDKDFGGVEREDEFGNIFQTTDGGFLIAGNSYSGISGSKSENNLGVEQTWIIKTDQDGNKLWDKTIFTSGHDEEGWIVQTTDGCFAVANHTNGGIAGYVTQPNHDTGLLTYDYWIAKFCDTSQQNIVHYTTADQTICAGTCIDFTNQSHGYDSYVWSFPGATTGSDTSINPRQICYPAAGNFTVSLVASNGLDSDTMALSNYIRVAPLPQPFSISFTNNALVVPQAFTTYQWHYQNQPVNGANAYYWVPLQNGNYSVSVMDANGCHGSAEIRSIEVGTNDLSARDSRLEVFPNPAMDVLYVFFVGNSSFNHVSLTVRNVLGEALIEEKVSEERTVIGLNKISPGMYFIEITTTEKKLIKRFIKL